MKTAVYLHRNPSEDAMRLIRQGTAGDTVLTNFPLTIPHTRYQLQRTKKSAGAIWGTENPVHFVQTDAFPFNWMLCGSGDIQNPYYNTGIVAALAKDSDRIMLMFPKTGKIPALLIFLAMVYNRTVRIFQGSQKVNVRMEDLVTPQLKKQYERMVLPTLDPLPRPSKLMQTPNGATVRPYQQQLVDFGLTHPYAGWFVDMGLGKTLSALVLLDQWIQRKEIDPKKPILIVAPIMVALDTWSREAAKWGYDWNIRINVRLTPKKREMLLRELLLPCEKPTLFLTNPDQLGPIRDYYYSFNIPLPFEVFIIDELSMFKSATSKRSVLAAEYRQGMKKFLGLTGTPAADRLLDVWNQLKLIDREHTAWAGENIYEFQDRYFVPVSKSPRGFVRKWAPKFGAEDVIYRQLSSHVVSMKTEGLVELPEISYANLFITMPQQAKAEYERLQEEMSEQEDAGSGMRFTMDDGYQLYVPNSEVLSGKLLQLAVGSLYTNTETHTFKVIHDEKLAALDDLIETATSPILVFYFFESDKIRIENRYKNRIPILDSKDKNVSQVISQWNNGEIPVLLAHPASVGHGLNLQDGGHTIVWFSYPNWNNDVYRQANKRLYRSGQKYPVNVIHIVAKNTIEEVMIRSFNAKEKVNDQLMSALDRTERGM